MSASACSGQSDLVGGSRSFINLWIALMATGDQNRLFVFLVFFLKWEFASYYCNSSKSILRVTLLVSFAYDGETRGGKWKRAVACWDKVQHRSLRDS